jgi:PRTRC genetic system protein E
MFKELAPLVRHRALLLTVTHVEDDQFRVNVIPKKVTKGENDALTTPVSVTGTAEDLDRELPATLLHFVCSHLELKNTLDRARAEMEEASKTARAEARKKSGNQTTRNSRADDADRRCGGPRSGRFGAPGGPLPAAAEAGVMNRANLGATEPHTGFSLRGWRIHIGSEFRNCIVPVTASTL